MSEDDNENTFKTLFDVVIPDLDYYLRQIDCRDGCPVNTDPRGYMMALHSGKMLEGYKIARGPNPFASICGIICGAPCEISCRRDRVDKTLTIRAQKRYLDEWFGLDKEAHIKSLEMSYARGSTNPKPNGLKVACIGAGVASLTAAHDLLRLGYAVDVYEMMRMAGGMLTYGVPTYRLKNEVALNEIAAIEHLGAKIYYDMKLGRDITLDELEEKYDAIFLGVGLWKSRDLPIDGADEPDIIRGIEYLRVRCADQPWKIGKELVVIGGGNVAFDAARTSIRNKAEKVTMVCLESRDEQTADEFEIEDGMEEGVKIINRVAPKAVMRDENGRICGLKVQQIHRLFDHDGKFNPQLVPETETIIPCDSVVLAIGQSMDTSFLNGWKKRDALAIERGVIKTEKGTGRTSVKGIYAGGDAAFGAALFITAIRHGQEAARAIDHDLLGTTPYREFVGEFTEISPMRDKTYLRTKWALPSLQPAEIRKTNLNMVENNYTDQEAHEQSNRCLQCHVSPVFDGSLCIKCNGCVDVCPCNCLKLVPISQLNLDAGEGNLRKAVDHYYGVDSYEMEEDEMDQMGSAMLKDEDLCIRCGLCAEKCPTQAVTMDAMNYTFRWIG
ncbi:pyridine nucleotide-disulfide oxidoreductase [Waddlia chondrophila 2032/99]|uniref:Pyridine nucleotide-disulfide oxidoreductase n=2 Tax=Waddlia chondrophila TaxID=71667 RepID=D6YTA8_WADCW|nr:FAD-dependent oxidoreductase [Waddlia chondrophila]ADI39303.1 Pyridine nucleotide-disulfide oxidoreductase [Waddlia chondrophila WSU 86-1044]CCB90548.1 pyridine nucleotide-disulfide oxidoreductase [Waddlia chondrophila 2032/99]